MNNLRTFHISIFLNIECQNICLAISFKNVKNTPGNIFKYTKGRYPYNPYRVNGFDK